jgi:hypothetical protein
MKTLKIFFGGVLKSQLHTVQRVQTQLRKSHISLLLLLVVGLVVCVSWFLYCF